jgi:hypothetical protein
MRHPTDFPSPTLPMKGRVRLSVLCSTLPNPPDGTSPLVGEDGRGKSMEPGVISFGGL